MKNEKQGEGEPTGIHDAVQLYLLLWWIGDIFAPRDGLAGRTQPKHLKRTFEKSRVTSHSEFELEMKHFRG